MVREKEAENYFKNRIADMLLLFQCGVYCFPGEELFYLDLTKKMTDYGDESHEG